MAVPAAAFAAPAFVGSSAAPRVTTQSANASSTVATASCPRGWGSLPKAGNRSGMAEGALTNVRAGRHACFDRLVIDIRDRGTSYRIRYVPAVTQDASGKPVPLRGGAKLQIIVSPPDVDLAGHQTYFPANRRELVNTTGYRTLRQVAWAGTFEGQTTLGVGVRARLPFRVFTLAGPGTNTRLVVDVAHRW
jgi:hypothetical protein